MPDRAMLSYEAKPVLSPESPGNLVVSLVLGSLACVVGIWLWWQTTPGLWILATFYPKGPITPMGFTVGLVLLMLGGMINLAILVLPAAALSKRSWARIITAMGALASALPALNFLAFFVIIFVRRIQLGG